MKMSFIALCTLLALTVFSMHGCKESKGNDPDKILIVWKIYRTHEAGYDMKIQHQVFDNDYEEMEFIFQGKSKDTTPYDGIVSRWNTDRGGFRSVSILGWDDRCYNVIGLDEDEQIDQWIPAVSCGQKDDPPHTTTEVETILTLMKSAKKRYVKPKYLYLDMLAPDPTKP